jgi:hypothetical protein
MKALSLYHPPDKMVGSMSAFKEWWSGNGNPNGLGLLGAAFVLIANVVITYLMVSRSEEHAEELLKQQFSQTREMAQKAEVSARSKEIRDAASDFSTFAAAYVTAVLDAPSEVPLAKRRLTDNVLKQLSTVTMSGGVFPNDIQDAAKSYKLALYDFSDALSDADTVLKMRPFWERASDVLVAREELLSLVDTAS